MVRGLLLACSLAGLSFCSQAGSLVQSHIMAGPTMSVDKSGKVESCAINIVAVEDGLGESMTKPRYFFSGAAIVYHAKAGLVRGRYNRLPMRALEGDWTKIKSFPQPKFWFKAPNEPATTVIEGQKVEVSTDYPGHHFYAADGLSVLDFVLAVANDETIQIGASSDPAGHATVFFGKVQMEESKRGMLLQCLHEWGKNQQEALAKE